MGKGSLSLHLVQSRGQQRQGLHGVIEPSGARRCYWVGMDCRNFQPTFSAPCGDILSDGLIFFFFSE